MVFPLHLVVSTSLFFRGKKVKGKEMCSHLIQPTELEGLLAENNG